MASVSYEVFLPDIQPRLMGAPKQVVLNAVRDAVIEFCDESGVLRRVLDPVVIPAGETEGDIDAPSGERICRVDSLTDRDSGSEILQDSYSLIDTYIKLNHPSTSNLNLTPLVSVKPKRSTTSCDNLLYEDYHTGIVEGALSKLYLMAGREWADSKAADVSYNEFRKSIVKAKHNTRTSRVARLGTVTQRSFE